MLYRNAEPVLRAQNADENALYMEKEEGENRQQQLYCCCLSVEPVLRTIFDGKATLDATAVLGCHASSGVYPVDFVVSPGLSAFAGGSGVQLQPWDATQPVGALGGGLGCGALAIDCALDTAVVDSVGLKHEERDTGGGELVVT